LREKEAGTFRDEDRSEGDEFSAVLTSLAGRIRSACATTEAWPAKVGVGLYAGIDYLLEDPEDAQFLLSDRRESAFGKGFREVVKKMTDLLSEAVPLLPKPRDGTPAAVVAGVGLVVGEHIRLGRPERLHALRPELHLLMLLPFLPFEEAQRWVTKVQGSA
jgi:hypothetical protein